jgi:hypothetical protein
MEEASVFYQRSRCCPDHASVSTISPNQLDGATGSEPYRFCQKCGRFQAISKFDGVKKSCRRQLIEHNARRKQARTQTQATATTLTATTATTATAMSTDLDILEEDIIMQYEPTKPQSNKKTPRKKSISAVTPTGAAGQPSQDISIDPFLPPSGEILKSNWNNLFPTSPMSVRPTSFPTSAFLNPLETNSHASAALETRFIRLQHNPTEDSDGPRIVLPPPLPPIPSAAATRDDASVTFDRSVSLEDDPIVALPDEAGTLLEGGLADDETPPLPSGEDWCSPPKTHQYIQEPLDYLLQNISRDVLMQVTAPGVETEERRRGGIQQLPPQLPPRLPPQQQQLPPQQQQMPPRDNLSPRLSAALEAASFKEYGAHYSELSHYIFRELHDRIKGKMEFYS